MGLGDLFRSNPSLQEDSSFFRYSGSHSTPPCSPRVEHFLMEQPAYLDSHQSTQLRSSLSKAHLTSNVRRLQPLLTTVYY